MRFDLLSDRQFGFRKNSSTIFAINKIYDELLSNIDQDLYSCCICLDLSKAFDTVNHKTLLQKLESFFGFRGTSLKLIENYLTDKYQPTKIGEARSSLRKVDCGVPQGSSLGPLLFLLYVNDLPLTSQFTTTLFADDTLLALFDDNLAKLECRVNAQLRHIDLRLKQNKLTLNHSKTTYRYLLFNKEPHVPVNSTFSLLINNNEITKSNSVKYLGVWFDDKLNWSAHIQDLSLQLAKCSNMQSHIRDFVTGSTLAMLYYSFVYSRITYEITAWGTASRNFPREVEVKQNNIIRTVTWNKKFSHVNHLYKQLNILKLVDAYKLELAKFMHKLFNNKLPKLRQQNFTKIELIHDYTKL